MKEYKPRIADEQLKLKLEAFGATLIVGQKAAEKQQQPSSKQKVL